jgi:GTPase SAR1 family protein
MWLNSIQTNCPDNIPKIIIGNKIDSNNIAVTTKSAKAFADTNNIKLFETSAKRNDNVNESFNYLFLEMIKYKKEIKRESLMISHVRESVKHKCKC